MSAKTVKISNISSLASQRDVQEFFSFSGDIDYVELQSESENTQCAYVTFKESQGAENAILLTGATIVDRAVAVTPAPNYKLPAEAYRHSLDGKSSATSVAVEKAEDVVSSMLAKGFVLSKDALHKAKSFDEQHRLLSTASATVASLDKRIGLSEKLSTGMAMVSSKVREVDERFQVSGITRSALATAEQTATNTGSAILSNPYVSTGASWLSSALGKVMKAAEDVSMMTREKVEKAEEERKEMFWNEKGGVVSEYVKVHLDEPLLSEPPTVPVYSMDEEEKLRTL